MHNNLFIISGPSGAGEDSIINGLKQILPIETVITTTSRQMRPGESEGHPYYFISEKDFKNGIKNNRFFEYACEYNNKFYGVTHEEINRVKNSNKIGIWKIEYQGVIYAKKIMPDIVAILISAPPEQLINRLKKRGGMNENMLQERMKYTKKWLEHRAIYDHEVINKDGNLEESIDKTANIIKKYRKNTVNL
jgi:guanylate kinase